MGVRGQVRVGGKTAGSDPVRGSGLRLGGVRVSVRGQVRVSAGIRLRAGLS